MRKQITWKSEAREASSTQQTAATDASRIMSIIAAYFN